MNVLEILNNPVIQQMLMLAMQQQQVQNMETSQMPNFKGLPISKPKKRKGYKPRKGEELIMAAQMGMPLTRVELASLMRCCPETITNLCKRGLPCHFLGKRLHTSKGSDPRFIYSDVQTWLEKQVEAHKGTDIFEDFIRKYAA